MFSSKKPYSSVTVAIERLTNESYEEDDLSGIPDLVEAISLQSSGPTEAARVIRKKLKYGDEHRQIRALVILDGLIQNAGDRFQRTFADEMLLERLRVAGTSELSSPKLKKKCTELYRSWAVEYKNKRGLEQIAGLYKEIPRRKQVVTQERSKVLRETEENPFENDDEEEDEIKAPPPIQPTHGRKSSLAASQSQSSSSSAPSASFFSSSSTASAKKSKKDKKTKKSKVFNLAEEKETMKNCIAEASVASTNLLNALKLINREHERISENKNAIHHFEFCKLLRRKILRYIQHVESEEWLGGLLHANDELVTALMTFEQLDRSIDADSDSDDELAEQQNAYRRISEARRDSVEPAHKFANMSISTKSPEHGSRPAQPPRSIQQPVQEDEEDDLEEEDENDPFADRNAVATPHVERSEPVWKDV